MTVSHDAEHFRRLYARSADPWGFRTSGYEQEKYRRTIAALGERRFRSGFEPGCSIGVLTRMLATRCGATAHGTHLMRRPAVGPLRTPAHSD